LLNIGKDKKIEKMEISSKKPLNYIPFGTILLDTENVSDFLYPKPQLTKSNEVTVVETQVWPLSIWYNRLIKRVFDVVLSLLVIVLVFDPLAIALDDSTEEQITATLIVEDTTTVDDCGFWCSVSKFLFGDADKRALTGTAWFDRNDNLVGRSANTITNFEGLCYKNEGGSTKWVKCKQTTTTMVDLWHLKRY